MERFDADRLAAWVSLAQAHAALVEGIERRLEEARDLPMAWYEVLVRLATAPAGELRMHDLARSVFLSKSGLTRLVDRMEGAGLVGRRSCAADRRGTYAVMTPEGRQALDAAAPVFLAALREQFGRHLEDDDVRCLRETLDKLIPARDGVTPDVTEAYAGLPS
jgi:DNA-binding MarR family transcriptional regulator